MEGERCRGSFFSILLIFFQRVIRGFTPYFFHCYWDIVGHDIVRAVRSFMYSGRLLRGINHTHIVLIPKVKCPMSTGQLRPISLCNVVYRVVPNVLANRLSE